MSFEVSPLEKDLDPQDILEEVEFIPLTQIDLLRGKLSVKGFFTKQEFSRNL